MGPNGTIEEQLPKKICRPSVGRLSTDSSPTDDQQSGGRQIKTNSGLLKKTDTQTISFSLMIEYELSRWEF